MRKTRWTPEEDGVLKTLWEQGYTTDQLVDHLPGRTYGGVAGRCHALGLGRRPPHLVQGSRAWSPEEDHILIEFWSAGLPVSVIQSRIPDRTYGAVQSRANLLPEDQQDQWRVLADELAERLKGDGSEQDVLW